MPVGPAFNTLVGCVDSTSLRLIVHVSNNQQSISGADEHNHLVVIRRTVLPPFAVFN